MQRIKPNLYVQLKNGDMLRFGESTRIFAVQGGPLEDELQQQETQRQQQQGTPRRGETAEEAAAKEQEQETERAAAAAAAQAESGKDLFTGNIFEFKQFMKKQRGKTGKASKSKEAKKLKEQLPELSRKVQGLTDDSDSDEDEAAAAPDAAEELPEDLELATRVTAAEEMYDSGDEGDQFYDRTVTGDAAAAESDSDSDEEEDVGADGEPVAKKKKKKPKKQTPQQAAAKKAQTVESLTARVHELELQKENLVSACVECV